MNQEREGADGDQGAVVAPAHVGTLKRATPTQARLRALLEALRIPALVVAAEAVGFPLVFWVNYVGSRGWRVLPPDIVADVLAPGLEFVAVVNMIWVVILVHEAGHILAGWLVGFRFRCLWFGPVSIVRTRRGLSCQPSDARRYAVSSCPVGARGMVTRFVVYALGGSAANLVLAVVAFMAVVSPRSHLSGFGLRLIVVLGLLSLWVGLCCLIPIRVRGQNQDGKQILDALRHPSLARRNLALQGLTYMRIRGVRPRCWPASLVRHILRPVDATVTTGAAWSYASGWALDRRDFTTAAGFLQLLLSDAPAAQQLRSVAPLIPLEAAYFYARHGNDPAASRQWLAVDSASQFAVFMRWRAEAAIHLVEGRPEEALAAAEHSLVELVRLTPELEQAGMEGETEAEDLWQMVAEARKASQAIA
jgi:hypothetical protein